MSIKALQADIRKREGYILSDGTLQNSTLLAKAFDLIVAYNFSAAKRKNLLDEIARCFTWSNIEYQKDFAHLFPHASLDIPRFYSYCEIVEAQQEDASWIWNESLYNLFNNIAPKGYYFGSSEGDGACIGWFKIETEY